jgi:gamma-glutamyltranspeptidase/glutathione hydrolase
MLDLRKPFHCFKLYSSCCLLLLLLSSTSVAQIDAVSKKGMVVSARPEASQVGVSILNEGGNAVDAAIATAFALAVTFPEAGNIGGGGFMMVYSPETRKGFCVDYRETAPLLASEEMFTLGENKHQAKYVGTPGTVAGLALAHRQYGKLPWKRLVMPAVKLAQKGFRLDEHLAASLNRIVADSPKHKELRKVYGKAEGEEQWRKGDRLVLPDLAHTLERIALHGEKGFYEGPVADLLVKTMQQNEGLISHDDLKSYKAKLREPIQETYREFQVYGAPPPSSGGTCITQMFQVLENFNLNSRDRWSPKTIHILIETMRRAYKDRAQHLGDPDFNSIPKFLTSKKYADELARTIDLEQATKSEALSKEIPLVYESEDTTHFSVIDKDGMAVSNTYTLENSFGSRVVVPGAGFLLNNEMGDFNPKAGHTDTKGTIGTSPNLVAPKKRMLSSQCPIIITKNDQVYLITGSPGGRTIINTTLQVALNVIDFNMSLREAVDAPRLHHQWFPDRIYFEAVLEEQYQETFNQLKAMGHQVYPKKRRQGDAHSIMVDPETGEYIGAADRRTKNGTAIGQ